MAPPAGEALSRHQSHRKIPSPTPNSAVSSSCLKHEIFLHDWWLIKVDSDGHSKRLGVGGFTSRESQGIRCFSSAPIVKRCDAVTLTSADGITVMVHGHLNRSRTLENGFANEVSNHFVIGFPYYWEEFAVVPVDEEDPKPPHSPVSDGNKLPNAKNVYDIQGISGRGAPSTAGNESFQAKRNLEDVDSSRRVTRSRARAQALDKF